MRIVDDPFFSLRQLGNSWNRTSLRDDNEKNIDTGRRAMGRAVECWIYVESGVVERQVEIAT